MAVKKALSTEDGDLSRSFTTARTVPYKDVDLSFQVNPSTGDVYRKLDAESVKQGVKNLLMTNRLDKPFSPNFGGDFESLLFDLADPFMEQDIKDKVERVIKSYEPRAQFLQTRVRATPDTHEVFISVTFNIKNTDTNITLTTSINRLR
jgi:phage baseplate assembly protein W